jgi:hypothetical protein
LQLDHSVADVPQTIACFSVMLAFLVYIDRLLRTQAQPLGRTEELAIAGRLPYAPSVLHDEPHREAGPPLDRPTVAR